MTTTAEPIYAKCKDCDAEFPDRDTMSSHLHDTIAPTGEPGLIARGHQARVINPTEAEQRESRATWAISSALDTLYEELYEEVERGRCTAEEITKVMWKFDLRDGWDEYVAEADDD